MMKKYRVLVVDDEKPARETLLCLIDWPATAFEVVDTAKNGQEALEKYRSLQPDLIITDIQMPVMDGLSLIKEVRKENNRLKFVVLSCHEKFAYARAAIQMGVTDYLIKDLMTPQDLYAVLLKVGNELAGEVNMDYRGALEWGSLQRDEISDASRMVALKSIVFENLAISTKQSLVGQFDLDLQGDYFLLLVIRLDDYEKMKSGLDYSAWKAVKVRINQSIDQALKTNLGGESFYYQNGEFVAIVRLREIASQFKFVSTAYQIADSVRRNIHSDIRISVTIGISQSFYGFKDIYQHYQEALGVTKYKILLGKGKILFYNAVFVKHNHVNQEMISDRIGRINQAAEANLPEQLVREMRLLYREDIPAFMQYHYLQEVNARIFGLMMVFCNIWRIKYDDVFGCNYIPLQRVEKMDTAQEIGEWFCQAFARMMAMKMPAQQQKYSSHVQDAIAYIALNYHRDIGLTKISEVLNLHKVYLCRLFKQETGENLIKYIMRFRVEEAKRRLMATNHRINYIAEQVGYPNQQQFNAAFKKIFGMSPAEFREINMGS